MPLASEETKDSKVNVPKGTVWGMVLVIVLNFGILFTCVATPNSDLAGSAFPLIAGFSRMLGTKESDNQYLYLLLVPPMAMACYSFIFAYSRQMFAMSRSGLLPAWVSLTNSRGVPWASTLAGSAIGYSLCLIGRLAFTAENFPQYANVLYNMMLMVAVINYLLLLVAYIILQHKYSMLARKYNSPVGVPGAVVGFAIFLVGLIGLLGWSVHIEYSIAGCLLWFSVGMVYYILVSSKKLILSPEEQFTMFMLYSVKFIQTKERRLNARKYSEGAAQVAMERSERAAPSKRHSLDVSINMHQKRRNSSVITSHRNTLTALSAANVTVAG